MLSTLSKLSGQPCEVWKHVTSEVDSRITDPGDAALDHGLIRWRSSRLTILDRKWDRSRNLPISVQGEAEQSQWTRCSFSDVSDLQACSPLSLCCSGKDSRRGREEETLHQPAQEHRMNIWRTFPKCWWFRETMTTPLQLWEGGSWESLV